MTDQVPFVYAPTISIDLRPYSCPIDKTLQKRQKTGYNGPNPIFLLIKSYIKPQLTFSLFYDLSTFDPCFLLLPAAYSLGAMHFFPECKLGWVCPSDVCPIRIIRLSSFQIESVSALVWKRPVFQSWAYWRLACAHTRFSFSRRVTNTAFEGTKIHFLIRFPVSRLRRSCCRENATPSSGRF